MDVWRLVAERDGSRFVRRGRRVDRTRTGADVPKRQVEEVAVAPRKTSMHSTRVDCASPEATRDLLVLIFDGKGIAMRHAGLREATRRVAGDHAASLRDPAEFRREAQSQAYAPGADGGDAAAVGTDRGLEPVETHTALRVARQFGRGRRRRGSGPTLRTGRSWSSATRSPRRLVGTQPGPSLDRAGRRRARPDQASSACGARGAAGSISSPLSGPLVSVLMNRVLPAAVLSDIEHAHHVDGMAHATGGVRVVVATSDDAAELRATLLNQVACRVGGVETDDIG